MPRDRRRDDVDRPREREAAEEEVQTPQREPTRDRDPLHDQYGNQGVRALLGIETVLSEQPGDPLGFEVRGRIEAAASREHGGDEAPEAPVDPLVPDDPDVHPLRVASRQRAPVAPIDPDPLPDEDWTERSPAPVGPAEPLEPSRRAAEAPTAWARQAFGTPENELHTAWRQVVVRPAPVLADPDGREIFVRARMLALARWWLQSRDRDPGLDDRLEIAVLGPRVRAAIAAVRPPLGMTPRAVDVADLGTAGGERTPGAPSNAVARLIEAWGGPLPDLGPQRSAAPPPTDADEDPLGLDQVLTGALGRPDPEKAAYESAVETSERLASQAVGLRVRHGVGVATLRRTFGVSVDVAHSVLERLDEATEEVLGWLGEMTRAAEERSVPLDGIERGLRRASRALRAAHEAALHGASELVGGAAGPPLGWTPRPLDQAWDDGQPHAAQAIAQRRTGPDAAAVRWLTDVAAGVPPSQWIDAAPSIDRTAAAWIRSAGWIALGEPLTALETLGADLDRSGSAIGLAASTLTAMDALVRLERVEEALERQRQAMAICQARGGGAAITLLARWRR